jgi:uncharacterized damage-inducible protein DinB
MNGSPAPLRPARALLSITPLPHAPENTMKLPYAALLTLTLPLGVAAQQPQGPQPNPITTVFRTRTLALQRNLAQAFDSVPESKFGFKPTPAQLTIGYIAQHLAADNYFFCNNFGAMKAAVAADEESTPDSVKAKWPKDKLVTNLKASFKFCEDAFAQLDDAKLADQVTTTFGGQSRQSPRVSMVLGHVVDMADHYSQMANYMRLNGILPPTALPRPPARD